MTGRLTPDAREDVYAENSEQALVWLARIKHPDLAETLYVTNNTVDITSRGQVYTALPFEVDPPAMEPGGVGKSEVRIDNIASEEDGEGEITIAQRLEAVSGQPTIELETIFTGRPDTPETGVIEGRLSSVDYGEDYEVRGEVRPKIDLLNEPCPGPSFSQDKYPALFLK